MKRNSGFTLIELLVVITIIGILAGLAFPAIKGALDQAKKAEATAMISQLKIAMGTYQTEYGVWPSSIATSSGAFNAGVLFDMLQGKSSAAADNPRRVVFMEFNSKSLRESEGDRTPPATPSDATIFVDPWNQQYQMQIDHDYNNEIAGPDGTVYSSVIIWSTGKADSAGTFTFDDKDPKSW
ncbi:MAG: prepilin-type N-terminal cleavage/methylation domain-containing protein [Verrucomicrobiota bacterium]